MTHSPPKTSNVFKRAMPLLALAVCAGFASVPAWAQSPVAGTPIGNQATATYNDGSNIQQNVQSNSVTTTIQQVAAVVLTAPRNLSAAPGSPVAFPHTIQNNGNGTDSFNITLSTPTLFGNNLQIFADANQDGVPDNNTPITATPSLAPGQKFSFVIVGTVPPGQAAGTTGTFDVTATSVNTPTVFSTNTDTVTASNNATIALRKSLSGPTTVTGVGPVYTYTLRYTNNSNVDAGTVVIADQLNPALIYRADSGRSSLNGTTVLTDTPTDGAQNGVNYGVNGAAGGAGRTVTATITSVPRNSTGSISFDVTLANGAPGTIPNSATVNYDDNNDNPNGNNPNATPPVTDTSNNVDLVVAQNALVAINNNNQGTVTQGATVTFTNRVTNNGNGTDSFNIALTPGSFPAGTTFQFFKTLGAATLLDTNGDGIPDTGPIPANTGPTGPPNFYDVVVKAKLPANFSGPGGANPTNTYQANITATSVLTPSVTATGTDTVDSITAATVELTNTNNPNLNPVGPRIGQGPLTGTNNPVIALTGAAGTVVRFPLSANNQSTVNDNYALSFTTQNPAALPAGFSVVFRDANGQVITNTGNIPAGGFVDYFADVTIPAGAAPQRIDLLFAVTSGASGATDTIRDRLTVATARAITITPNNQGQVFPGSSVNYAHVISNNGNATETNIGVALTDSTAGFSSVIYADNGAGANAGNGILDADELAAGPLTTIPMLAAGGKFPVIVKVFGPNSGATSGAVNTTTITATATQGTAPNAATITATATDITTIVTGDVTLTKSQSVLAANGTTVVTANTQGNAQAVPGQIIRYTILVRNTGGAPVTNIVVSDTTPNFTAYTTTGGAAAVTGAGVTGTITAPANGSAGTLTFTIPTLAPGATATATFNVLINNN